MLGAISCLYYLELRTCLHRLGSYYLTANECMVVELVVNGPRVWTLVRKRPSYYGKRGGCGEEVETERVCVKERGDFGTYSPAPMYVGWWSQKAPRPREAIIGCDITTLTKSCCFVCLSHHRPPVPAFVFRIATSAAQTAGAIIQKFKDEQL